MVTQNLSYAHTGRIELFAEYIFVLSHKFLFKFGFCGVCFFDFRIYYFLIILEPMSVYTILLAFYPCVVCACHKHTASILMARCVLFHLTHQSAFMCLYAMKLAFCCCLSHFFSVFHREEIRMNALSFSFQALFLVLSYFQQMALSIQRNSMQQLLLQAYEYILYYFHPIYIRYYN